LSGLGELMETMRRAQEKMAHTFNRFREDRTTGFKGFPGIYDGDFCATLTTKERVRLAFVKDDAIASEATGGTSLVILNLLTDEMYDPGRLEPHFAPETVAQEIRDNIVSFMDSKPGTGYVLPEYLKR
jgi:hypothetical protein